MKTQVVLYASVAALLCTVSSGAAVAQNVQIPDRPTFAECADISQQLYARARDAHRVVMECLLQDPIFGQGETCSGGSASMAWVQCDGLEVAACHADWEASESTSECQRRAREAAKQEQAELAKTRANDTDYTSLVEKSRNAYEKIEADIAFIQNPKLALTKFLAGKADEQLKFLLTDGMSERDGKPSMTEEVYRVAMDAARRNQAGLPPNPVDAEIIGSIQEQAFDTIATHFNVLLNQLDKTMANASQINSEYSKHNWMSVPPPAAPSSPGSADCAILSDPAKSSALMMQDRNTWLSLVATCKG